MSFRKALCLLVQPVTVQSCARRVHRVRLHLPRHWAGHAGVARDAPARRHAAGRRGDAGVPGHRRCAVRAEQSRGASNMRAAVCMRDDAPIQQFFLALELSAKVYSDSLINVGAIDTLQGCVTLHSAMLGLMSMLRPAEDRARGALYPPVCAMREVSAKVACAVAKKVPAQIFARLLLSRCYGCFARCLCWWETRCFRPPSGLSA